MLRCSATRAMTRTLHEPWPKPKRPPSAGDPPSQSAAPQKTAESISRKPYHSDTSCRRQTLPQPPWLFLRNPDISRVTDSAPSNNALLGAPCRVRVAGELRKSVQQN